MSQYPTDFRDARNNKTKEKIFKTNQLQAEWGMGFSWMIFCIWAYEVVAKICDDIYIC